MVGLTRAFLRASLFQLAVLCFAGVTSAQSDVQTPPATPGQPIPGTLGVAPFSGSVPVGMPTVGVLPLSLQDAINRVHRQNLGALLSSCDIQSARGLGWEYLSALLPHATADAFIDVSRSNLSEIGFKDPAAIGLLTGVGPFSYIKVDSNGRYYKGPVSSVAGATGPLFSLLPPENATGSGVKIVQRIPVKIVLEPGENKDRQLRPGMNVEPKVYL